MKVLSEPAVQPNQTTFQTLEGEPGGPPEKMDNDEKGKGTSTGSDKAAVPPATQTSASRDSGGEVSAQQPVFTMEPTPASTRYQYFFGISAGFAAMTAGAWLGWPSSTIDHLTKKEVLIGGDVSTMVALMDFGNMLSPIPAGYLMDIIGRKITLLGTAVVYLIASLGVLVYENKWPLFIARIMAGLGKGIAFSVVPIYLAEISNVQIRGALSTMFIGFLNFGMFYGYVVGPFTSYFVLNLAILAIPLSFLATFLFFPESPYFLLMKSRESAARKALSTYRKVDKANAEQMTNLDHELSEMSRRVERDMKNKGRFFDLVSTKGNRRAILIIAALAFFQRSSGISPTLAYSTMIMPQTGGGLTPKVYMIIFSALLIVANFLALPLVDRIGRKPLLLISSISTGLCTADFSTFSSKLHEQEEKRDCVLSCTKFYLVSKDYKIMRETATPYIRNTKHDNLEATKKDTT
ncbi:hypothetical protein GE061_019463 [Apolygus lucorum]|uniref:Major facilitator superfamily (MFS) profile domain-containing protein n=1 Tax=Apolygus lucorum TaxID=248454 RepID=A0A6A4J6X9_APOLU|nr:hypothetical protein GE061_019463 [Apolygus lucorum]